MESIQHRIRQEIELAVANSIIVNQDYLDDEQLTRERQFAVLTDIFNERIRENDTRSICNHFAPMFRDGHPIHLSILGKTGTGKTITVLYLLNEFEQLCRTKKIAFSRYHLDLCCPAPCFRALNNLACLLGASKHYKKGISLEELMHRIETRCRDMKGYLILFIDEADNIRTDVNTFYQFLVKRLPQKTNAKVIMIFASNRMNWNEQLDPRVSSALKVREIVFTPYDADDLRRILELRVKRALRRERIEEGVIEKIAALSSRQHGDARKAIDLLTRSAYLAEKNASRLTQAIVDLAYEEMERDKYLDMIQTSPKHLQAALYAAISGAGTRKFQHTGDAYCFYERFCLEAGLAPLTQRAFSDLITELDMYGFIRARTVSHGRYGRSKEIRPAVHGALQAKLIATIRDNFDMR